MWSEGSKAAQSPMPTDEVTRWCHTTTLSLFCIGGSRGKEAAADDEEEDGRRAGNANPCMHRMAEGAMVRVLLSMHQEEEEEAGEAIIVGAGTATAHAARTPEVSRAAHACARVGSREAAARLSVRRAWSHRSVPPIIIIIGGIIIDAPAAAASPAAVKREA